MGAGNLRSAMRWGAHAHTGGRTGTHAGAHAGTRTRGVPMRKGDAGVPPQLSLCGAVCSVGTGGTVCGAMKFRSCTTGVVGATECFVTVAESGVSGLACDDFVMTKWREVTAR